MTNGKAKQSSGEGRGAGKEPSVNVAKYLNSIWLHLSALRCTTSRGKSSRVESSRAGATHFGAHLSGSSKTFLSAIKMRQQQQEQQLVESNLTVCTAHKAMSRLLDLPRLAPTCLDLPPQRVLQVAFWRFFLCFSFGFFFGLRFLRSPVLSSLRSLPSHGSEIINTVVVSSGYSNWVELAHRGGQAA